MTSQEKDRFSGQPWTYYMELNCWGEEEEMWKPYLGIILWTSIPKRWVLGLKPISCVGKSREKDKYSMWPPTPSISPIAQLDNLPPSLFAFLFFSLFLLWTKRFIASLVSLFLLWTKRWYKSGPWCGHDLDN